MEKQKKKEPKSSPFAENKSSITVGKRFKVNIYTGMKELGKIVKSTAIVSRIGKSSSWFSKRLTHVEDRGFVHSFSASDVALVNQALWQIGEELLSVHMEYVANHDEMAGKVKSATKDLFVKYITTEEMKLPVQWMRDRLTARPAGKYGSDFKPVDILALNFAIRKVGTLLLSVELTVPESPTPDTPEGEDAE